MRPRGRGLARPTAAAQLFDLARRNANRLAGRAVSLKSVRRKLEDGAQLVLLGGRMQLWKPRRKGGGR